MLSGAESYVLCESHVTLDAHPTQDIDMAYPITWFEIRGDDTAKLRGFYGELFGWQFDAPPGQAEDYAQVSATQSGIGGGVGKAKEGAGWVTVYASVPDLQAAIAQAVRLGGKLLRPIVELSELSFAVVADPEGHAVGLMNRKA
jgi:predicted enzyme related to lactoylglutathione lyase